jgi:hypothetical protein
LGYALQGALIRIIIIIIIIRRRWRRRRTLAPVAARIQVARYFFRIA